jgi:hypothetical protein
MCLCPLKNEDFHGMEIGNSWTNQRPIMPLTLISPALIASIALKIFDVREMEHDSIIQ